MRVRRGLTLLELVITISIMGLVASIGVTAFSSIITHREIVSTANLQTERAAAVRDMIRTWITAGSIQIQLGGNAAGRGGGSSVVTRTNPNAPQGVTAAVSTGDEVTFTTNALTPASAPSTRVRLFVDADDNTPEQGLTIEYQPSTNRPLQRRQLDPMLAPYVPMIGGMIVEYLDNRTHQWFAASQVATIQAIAIRITLQSMDETNAAYALPPLLKVPFIFKMQNAAANATNGRGG
jgi:prepilin-type N-terminal cleavage/methylation domain-containing protein